MYKYSTTGNEYAVTVHAGTFSWSKGEKPVLEKYVHSYTTVCTELCVLCVLCVCVCLPLKLLITSGMIWCDIRRFFVIG